MPGRLAWLDGPSTWRRVDAMLALQMPTRLESVASLWRDPSSLSQINRTFHHASHKFERIRTGQRNEHASVSRGVI
jgi:hypothetical protein